jgi:hypothetical protein
MQTTAAGASSTRSCKQGSASRQSLTCCLRSCDQSVSHTASLICCTLPPRDRAADTASAISGAWRRDLQQQQQQQQEWCHFQPGWQRHCNAPVICSQRLDGVARQGSVGWETAHGSGAEKAHVHAGLKDLEGPTNAKGIWCKRSLLLQQCCL